MKFNIRLLYLYLFSFIGLLIAVIGGVRLVQLGLNIYVFSGADQYEAYIAPAPVIEGRMEMTAEEIVEQKKYNQRESQRQRQREAAGALSMIIVGLPLYLYHWKTIQKESKSK